VTVAKINPKNYNLSLLFLFQYGAQKRGIFKVKEENNQVFLFETSQKDGRVSLVVLT
jgi:hypothetical protein